MPGVEHSPQSCSWEALPRRLPSQLAWRVALHGRGRGPGPRDSAKPEPELCAPLVLVPRPLGPVTAARRPVADAFPRRGRLPGRRPQRNGASLLSKEAAAALPSLGRDVSPSAEGARCKPK